MTLGRNGAQSSPSDVKTKMSAEMTLRERARAARSQRDARTQDSGERKPRSDRKGACAAEHRALLFSLRARLRASALARRDQKA